MAEVAGIDPGLDAVRTALLMIPFLCVAVITDLSDRRIPNIVVGLMLAFGLTMQLLTGASSALVFGLGGIATGLLILLPFYMLGGMGAGDVKLLAAAGSFLGPQGALIAGLLTLGAGAVLGLVVIAYRYLSVLRPARSSTAVPVQTTAPAQLPYSLAISAGTLITVMQW